MNGVTPYNVTLEFLSNMTCDLIQTGTPLFTCCTCIQAVPTGTVYGVDTDIIEYSLDGGLTWLPYGGECIDPDENTLTFRRTVTFTNGCPPAEITETYVPPGCENNLGLTVNCEPMVELWLIPITETNTLVSITIDGNTYTPPSPIPLTDYAALAAYFNGLGTNYYFLFSDGGPATDATVVSILGAPCHNYQIGDLFATYNDGVANQDIYLGLFYEQPCSYWSNLLPGYTCPECCTCATAAATGTATGINNDIIEYSIDGGTTWFEYFPPQCINPTIYPSNEVIFRRTVNFDNGCPPVVLTETIQGSGLYQISDNASSTDCEDPTAFAYINFVNTGTLDLPMGTVFNLVWTGLGGSPTFTSLTGGTVAPGGSTFTLDAYDIIQGAGFSFYVEWNNPGCQTYTLELTISSTDITIDPVTITLYLS